LDTPDFEGNAGHPVNKTGVQSQKSHENVNLPVFTLNAYPSPVLEKG
jgi:hypothetical protein